MVGEATAQTVGEETAETLGELILRTPMINKILLKVSLPRISEQIYLQINLNMSRDPQVIIMTTLLI